MHPCECMCRTVLRFEDEATLIMYVFFWFSVKLIADYIYICTHSLTHQNYKAKISVRFVFIESTNIQSTLMQQVHHDIPSIFIHIFLCYDLLAMFFVLWKLIINIEISVYN